VLFADVSVRVSVPGNNQPHLSLPLDVLPHEAVIRLSAP
jgi:hypothetical protein